MANLCACELEAHDSITPVSRKNADRHPQRTQNPEPPVWGGWTLRDGTQEQVETKPLSRAGNCGSSPCPPTLTEGTLQGDSVTPNSAALGTACACFLFKLIP